MDALHSVVCTSSYARRRCRRVRQPIALVTTAITCGLFLRAPRTWMLVPPGPDGRYEFHASRAILHLSLVPEPGPARSGIPGRALPKEVKPLSILGHTAGGSFYVEWDGSPFGVYKEVGLLSSLVTDRSKNGPFFGPWGGWASHVWVDSAVAAEGGRFLWGLPTSRCDIDVLEAGSDGFIKAFGKAPLVYIGPGVGPLGRVDRSSRITVGVLDGSDSNASAASWPFSDMLRLPNLSGCLPDTSPEEVAEGRDCRRLLTYDLDLQPRAIRIFPGRRPDGGDGIVPRADFSSWLPLFTIELLDVNVKVGIPKAC